MADFTADQVDLCLGEMVQDVAEDHVSASEVRLDTGACLPPVTILSVKTALLFRRLPPGPSQIPPLVNLQSTRGSTQKKTLISLLSQT